MANFALNYSFSRNLNIPLDEDAVKSTYAEVLTYVQTKSKCYAGQLFSVVGDRDNNGLYVAITTGADAVIIKLASQEALEAVAASAGKIDTIKLNGSALTINDKTVNIDLSTYATIDYVNETISGLTSVFAPKAEFEEVQKKVDDITSVGGEPNVQSDWNVVDEESDAFIKNKPNLDVYAIATAVTADIATAEAAAKKHADDEIVIVSGVVTTLIGEDVDKSARDIAAEEVAKVVASADSDFDTLKEIADWILNDTTGAANMANDIQALKLEDAAIDGRLDELEGKKHTHENKEVLDGISAEKVASWDAAEQNAKDYTDTEIGKLSEVYDVKGAAASAETAAKAYADTQVSDAKTSMKQYVDGLAVNYDAAGAAETALNSAKAHVSQEITKLSEVYDVKGAAASAETAAKAYADGLAVNYDEKGAAASAEAAAKKYADGLAVNYDAAGAAAGAAATALSNAKIYTNEEIAKLSTVYDAKGDAAAAEAAAKKYTDDKLVDYATQSFVTDKIVSALTNGTVDITGYAKTEDVKAAVSSAKTEAIADASAYTDSEIAKLSDVYASKSVVETLVGEDVNKSSREIASEEVAKVVAKAPEAFDTLKEIADWISNESGATAADIVIDIAGLKAADELIDGRIDALEVLSGQSHTHLNKEVLNGITVDKVTAWDAAEQNAKDYADGLAVNYDAAGAAASAETAAKAYADTLVENIKPYEGGVAASIEMGENDTYVVDVKVADDEKNFLNVNDSNELEVKEITLDVAKTSKEITIEGGKWADAVKTVFTGGTVPAGTTWESFLEAMLCVEKFAGTISISSSFTVTCGNINPGFDKSGTVEVGTKATLSATTANATTASQSLTAKTFTYGYKIGENGARTTATAYTETLTPVKTKSDDSLKITFTKFVDASGEAMQTITGNSTLAKVEMYVMEGENKVVVSQTGDTYNSSSAVTADTIYVSTNLKNYYKSDKVTTNTFTVTAPVTSMTAYDSTEYKVTGAHKYYIGDVVDSSYTYWDEDRSSAVQGFATSGWANTTTITKEHTFKTGTKQQTVVVPSKFTTVSGKDVNNGDVTFNKVKTFDFTNKQGYVSSYSVFVAPSFDGLGADSKITITIK